VTVFERYIEVKKALGITQTEIADANDVSQPALSGKESRGNISLKTLEFITKRYKVNLNWLFTGEGEMIESGDIRKDYENQLIKLREDLNKAKDEIISLYREKDELQKQLNKKAS
jgi:transcriptional regulator with XRE-family HTH domain